MLSFCILVGQISLFYCGVFFLVHELRPHEFPYLEIKVVVFFIFISNILTFQVDFFITGLEFCSMFIFNLEIQHYKKKQLPTLLTHAQTCLPRLSMTHICLYTCNYCKT